MQKKSVVMFILVSIIILIISICLVSHLISNYLTYLPRILLISFVAPILEAFFNIYWQEITRKKLFVYKYACIWGCNSSVFNFILWMAGINLVYLIVSVNLNGEHLGRFILFSKLYVIELVIIGSILLLINRWFNKKLKHMAFYSAFTITMTTLILLGYTNLRFLSLFFILGFTAHIIELLVNIVVKYLSGKLYWEYKYYPYKNGLSSIHNIIPFASGALLFIWLINLI